MVEDGTQTQEPNWLDMSDEDLLKMGPNEFLTAGSEPAPADPPKEEEEQEEETEAEADDGATAQGEGDAENTSEESEEESDDEGTDDAAESSTESEEENGTSGDDGKSEDGDAEGTAEEKDETTPPENGDVDYKAFYERMTGDIAANGKKYSFKDPDELERLIQFGLNYNQKMVAIKPTLKIAKLLEKNELLDEEKLGFLIDVSKGDPAAIGKLLKDSNIDPMSLDTELDSYKATPRRVDDRELVLDEVIDDIKDSPRYSELLDLVRSKWDQPSKQAISESPQILSVINGHMTSGVYDRITAEMDRLKVLGQLNGLSDVQAYRKVGDDLNARGAFDDLFGQQATANEPGKEKVTPPKKPADTARKKKVAGTKATPASTRTQPMNPLAMSDDDFLKEFDPRLV